MLSQEIKLAIVVSQSLPVGLGANAAAIVTMAMTKKADLIGADVCDADGVLHPGITTVSVRILEASDALLKEIHTRALALPEVFFTDMTTIAQSVHDNYEGYSAALSAASGDDIQYAAVALLGPVKTINKLTGSLRLFGKAKSSVC